MSRLMMDRARLMKRFYDAFNISNPRLEEILEAGLKALSEILEFESTALFRWDAPAGVLRMDYVFFKGELMEGEEEIPVAGTAGLMDLVSGKSPYFTVHASPFLHVYLPLWVRREFFGAVRLGGSQGRSGARLALKNEIAFVEDLGRTLALQVNQAYLLRKHEEQLKDLKALSEVSATVQESLKLREMLEGVSQSVLRNMGFDRVRFYVVDPSGETLSGVVGAEIPGRVVNLEEERHPLQKGQGPLADSLLSAKHQPFLEGSARSIAYVPLVLKGNPVGVCVADNLLSQQSISPEKLDAMSTVAGQVALAVSNTRLFAEIEEQAITDGLTKLYVVRYFSQRLREEVDRAERYSYPLALLMIDVDYFKGFNDTYGHPMGDRVLEFIAQTIRANIRKVDLAARYGGDEMVILLPDISQEEAEAMTNRLFKSINQCVLTVPGGSTIHVTVSMGVAMYPQDADSGKSLLECADRALYWVKAHGRADVLFFHNISQ